MKNPVLISGPFVSSITEQNFLGLSLNACRQASKRFYCDSWVPWEKLNRQTLIPASIILTNVSTSLHELPIVQTIFVFGTILLSSINRVS